MVTFKDVTEAQIIYNTAVDRRDEVAIRLRAAATRPTESKFFLSTYELDEKVNTDVEYLEAAHAAQEAYFAYIRLWAEYTDQTEKTRNELILLEVKAIEHIRDIIRARM